MKAEVATVLEYGHMNQTDLDLQPLEPSYRLIPLTRGQLAIVDATDHDWLMQWKWHAYWNKHSKSFYAVRRRYEPPNWKRGFHVSMARQIMGAPVGLVVDHINHNT